MLHQPIAAPVLVHVGLQGLEVRPELLAFPCRDDFRFFHLVRLVHNRPPPVEPVGSDAGIETGFPVQVQLQNARVCRDHPLVGCHVGHLPHRIALLVFPLPIHIDGQTVFRVVHLHHLHRGRHGSVRGRIVQYCGIAKIGQRVREEIIGRCDV